MDAEFATNSLIQDQLWHSIVARPEEAVEVGRKLGKGDTEKDAGRWDKVEPVPESYWLLATTKSVELADKHAQQSRWTRTLEQKALHRRNI